MNQEIPVIFDKLLRTGGVRHFSGSKDYDNQPISNIRVEDTHAGVQLTLSPALSIVVDKVRFSEAILDGMNIEDNTIKTEVRIGVIGTYYVVLPVNGKRYSTAVKTNGKEGFEQASVASYCPSIKIKAGDIIVPEAGAPHVFLGSFNQFITINYRSNNSAFYGSYKSPRSYLCTLTGRGLIVSNIPNKIVKVVSGEISPREARGLAFIKGENEIPVDDNFTIDQREYIVPKYIIEDGLSYNRVGNCTLNTANNSVMNLPNPYSTPTTIEGGKINTAVISSMGLTRPLCR